MLVFPRTLAIHAAHPEPHLCTSIVRLSKDELNERYAPEVTYYDIATLDGILFRPYNRDISENRTDNSGVMYPFTNPDAGGEMQIAYGYIREIIGHTIEWEGELLDTLVLIRVCWYKVLNHMHGGRLPVVQEKANLSWNKGVSQFINLGDIYAQNVTFLPTDGANWDMKGELVAILRNAETPIDFDAAD